MDRESYLRARGWVQHGAGLDLWCPPYPVAREAWFDGDEAAQEQRAIDRNAANQIGSVTYRPTAEQAQTSPLLAACAARGMCERETLAVLFEESEQRRAVAEALRSKMPPPRFVVAGGDGTALMADMLQKAQAIGAAWKALARAERAFAGAQSFGGVEARARAFQAVEIAKAALRALGVDPDADDEPGQVAT